MKVTLAQQSREQEQQEEQLTALKGALQDAEACTSALQLNQSEPSSSRIEQGPPIYHGLTAEVTQNQLPRSRFDIEAMDRSQGGVTTEAALQRLQISSDTGNSTQNNSETMRSYAVHKLRGASRDALTFRRNPLTAQKRQEASVEPRNITFRSS